MRASSPAHHQLVTEALFDWLASVGQTTNHPGVLAVLFLSAAVEYVFPPAPGDVITLGGAVLVGAYGWNLLLVYGVCVLGSTLGSLIALAVGKRWAKKHKPSARLDRLIRGFEKHGAVYLIAHRFVPGMRPLFFVAAGLSGMPTARAAFFSAVSALLWYAVVLATGIAIGNNLDALETMLHRYGIIVWSVLGALAVAWAMRVLWRRAKRRRRQGA